MGKVLLSEYTAVRTAVNNLYTDLKKSYTWVNNPSVGSKATCAAVEELHTAITAQKATAEVGSGCWADLASHYTSHNGTNKSGHDGSYNSRTDSYNNGHFGGWMGGRRTIHAPRY